MESGRDCWKGMVRTHLLEGGAVTGWILEEDLDVVVTQLLEGIRKLLLE